MNIEQLQDYLTARVHGDLMPQCQWWHAAALRCWEQRRVHLIMSRDGSELYLARFWLTPPALYATDRDGHTSDGSAFNSGNSTLLHFFARGDDDGSLHDHPWDFTTDVLSGGYTERRPTLPWRQAHENRKEGAPTGLGVDLAACDLLTRRPGDDRVMRMAWNQHAAEDVLPDTWTLVQTGPRVRSWFFHPPGREAVPWRDFLAEKRQQAQATP